MKCVFLWLLGVFKLIGNGATLTWSDSYSYEAVLTVPDSDILEIYKVWFDGSTGNTKVVFYNGLVKLYRMRLYGEEQMFAYFKIYNEPISTTTNQEVCRDLKNVEFNIYATNIYLPARNYIYQGIEQINGIKSHKWKASSLRLVDEFIVTFTHTVWVNYDSNNVTVPLRYEYKESVGEVIIDNFHHEYIQFSAAEFDKSIFDLPDGLQCLEMDLPEYEPYDPVLEYDPINVHAKISNEFKKFVNSQKRKSNSILLAVNYLADATDDEIAVYFETGDDEDVHGDSIAVTVEALQSDNVTNFDWRDYGAVSPVKDQTTMCGSSYAFAVAAAVESSLYIQSGLKKKLEVSEQAIVDCSWRVNKYGNYGCRDGDLRASLHWIMEHGIPYSGKYGRYLALEGLCHASEVLSIASISGYVKVQKDENVIKKYLRKLGPLAVTIDWSPNSIQFYSKGIYEDINCKSGIKDSRGHSLALIGYGEENGKKFWTLKNSRGPNWGEEGFIRIAIKNNICGVMNNVYSILTANIN